MHSVERMNYSKRITSSSPGWMDASAFSAPPPPRNVSARSA